MASDVTVDDLELFLPTRYRTLFAERDEEYCEGVQFDRIEPDPASVFPRRLVIFRDDGGDEDPFGVGEHSVGVSVLAGTKEDPTEAKQIARMVRALAPRLPGTEPGNPIAAFLGANGPYAVQEEQPRARQYVVLRLGCAGRPL